MTNEINIIKKKLNDYFLNKLTIEDLGQWAQKKYYGILTGQYIFLDKLVAYKFYKSLSAVHLPENDIADEFPTSNEELCEIMKVLNGELDISFVGTIRINAMFDPQVEILSEIRGIFYKWIKEDSLSKENKDKLYLWLNANPNQQSTIFDLLKSYINPLIEKLLNYDNHNPLHQTFGLYLKKGDMESEAIKLNITTLLESMSGEHPIHLNITFKNGSPLISILLT